MQKQKTAMVEKIVETLLSLAARRTSSSYAQVAVSSIMTKLSDKHACAKAITIKTTSYSSMARAITIDVSIEKTPDQEFSSFLKDLINDVSSLYGSQKETFFIEFKGYLGQDFVLKLENLNVHL